MNTHITIDQIRDFPLLNALPDDVLSELAKSITPHRLEEDEILFLEGQSINSLFFVLEGWLKTEKNSAGGRQQTLRLIGPGEVINELAVFSNSETSMSLIALENAMVFKVSRVQVEGLIENYPAFSRVIIMNLSKHIQHLLTQVENLSLYNVEARLARLLLIEAEDDVLIRHSWKTQSEIANQIGTVLDVVNRNLNKLENQGIIEVTREKIIIINRPELEEIARE